MVGGAYVHADTVPAEPTESNMLQEPVFDRFFCVAAIPALIASRRHKQTGGLRNKGAVGFDNVLGMISTNVPPLYFSTTSL